MSTHDRALRLLFPTCADDDMKADSASSRTAADEGVRRQVRFHIIRNARIENVGKSQSCMVSKLRVIWKQGEEAAAGPWLPFEHCSELMAPKDDVDATQQEVDRPAVIGRLLPQSGTASHSAAAAVAAGGEDHGE